MANEPEQDRDYGEQCYQCGNPAPFECADCGLPLCDECAAEYGAPGDDGRCDQCEDDHD